MRMKIRFRVAVLDLAYLAGVLLDAAGEIVAQGG